MNRHSTTLRQLAAALTVLGTAACATSPGSATVRGAENVDGRRAAQDSARVVTSAPQGNATQTVADREALYRARRDSARGRFTPADVRFMHNMMAHHAQAVRMARLAPSNGASPTIRVLAARIHNAQADEIAIMQRWLRARDQSVPAIDTSAPSQSPRTAAPGGAMHGDMHADHAMMPGMLTERQLSELAAAQGTAFDRLFLTLMIAHHKGAVVMVEELFATDGAGQDPDVFRFASDVQVDQRTEVARMERMLEELDSSFAF